MNISSEKFYRAIEIIQEDGLVALTRSSSRFVGQKLEDLFRHLKGKITLEVGGVKASFDSKNGSQYRKIEWRFQSEYDVLEDLIKELRPDDVFFDIGAGLGLHTCLPAKKIRDGKVIAVEPDPRNLGQLKKNIRLNRLDNIRILKLALADFEGTSEFNGYTINQSSDETGLRVNSAVGDNLVSQGQVPQPDVIKIDVEGSEPLVIKGLKNVLRDEACRLLYCEVHQDAPHRPSINDFGTDFPQFREMLENYGFNLTVLGKRRQELFIKGTKS